MSFSIGDKVIVTHCPLSSRNGMHGVITKISKCSDVSESLGLLLDGYYIDNMLFYADELEHFSVWKQLEQALTDAQLF